MPSTINIIMAREQTQSCIFSLINYIELLDQTNIKELLSYDTMKQLKETTETLKKIKDALNQALHGEENE